MNENLTQKVAEFVKSKPFVVYMKGTPEFPMCGFSARACAALFESGVKKEDLASFNILEDRPMFEALKQFSNWPTSPQVFIRGEFIGGCDIVCEMFERGELQKLVAEATKH